MARLPLGFAMVGMFTDEGEIDDFWVEDQRFQVEQRMPRVIKS